MSLHPVISVIREQRVVVIIRAERAVDAVEAGRAMFLAGYRAVEVSLTTPDGLSAIEELSAEVPTGAYLGAGTVMSPDMASAATGVGASFIVAPVTMPAVIERARHDGAAVIPGAATPTEMVRARDEGAELIKVFPSSLWSPALVTDVLTALPDLQLVPTGSVTVQTAPDWIRAGCVAVGMGGALTTGHPDNAAHAREFLGRLAC
jgi:2-dehydro-3-deoxyphosphogluconate aldolase/(4S)-4-hydroxy-2-oxoglutarate aldolase